MSRFEDCLPLLLAHEGGYVDDPKDPGGETNLGVTHGVWEAWRRSPVTQGQMRALTPAEVAPLYKANYWDAVAADQLPAGVDYMAFDGAVNQGPGRVRRWLQMAAGVEADGEIGPDTLRAVRALDPAVLLQRLHSRRWVAYRLDPDFDRFGQGWLNRLATVLDQAKHMIMETTA